MENIKLENTIHYQFLKSQVDFWADNLDKHNQSLIINPDSYFLKCIAISGKSNVSGFNEKFK